MKRILLSALAVGLCVSASAQKWRLIGMKELQYDGNAMELTDSGRYVYNTGNKYEGDVADLNGQMLRCDTNMSFVYIDGDVENAYMTTNFINAKGLMDTVRRQRADLKAGKWEHDWTYKYKYDAANNVIEQMQMAWDDSKPGFDTFMHIYSTYTAGKITKQMQITDKYQDTAITEFTYTGGNLTLMDITSNYTGSWKPQWQSIYTYDAANNNDTLTTRWWNDVIGKWGMADLKVMSYKGTQLATTKTYSWNPMPAGGWLSGGYYVYLYDAKGNKLVDSILSWTPSASAYLPMSVDRYTYTATNKLDSNIHGFYYSSDPTTMVLSTLDVNTYNTNDKHVRLQTYSWDDTAWTIQQDDRDVTYYYEIVPGSAQSVAGIQGEQTNITLYPNPAGDVLNIKLENKTNQPATVAIYNTMGMLLQQWEEKASNTSRTISTHSYETGNYILVVRHADGSRSTARFIVKH